MASTTVKKLKNQQQGQKFSFSSLLFALLALFLTVALFFGMIILQNYLSDEVVYQDVIVAKTDIPENVIITAENVDTYLGTQQINVLNITKGVLTSKEEILGQKAKIQLLTGEVLTLKDFENLNVYTDFLVDPVEISIGIDAVENADGGKIRAGDLVNLTMMFTNEQLYGVEKPYSISTPEESDFLSDVSFEKYWQEALEMVGIEKEEEPDSADEESHENREILINPNSGTSVVRYNYDTWAQYVMEGLYVSKVLNSDGLEIAPEDADANAAIVIFVIEKADEPDLNNALMNCQNMRISKSMLIPKEAENVIPGQEPEQKETVTETEKEEMQESAEEPTEEAEDIAEDLAEESKSPDISRDELLFEGYFEVLLDKENPDTYHAKDGSVYTAVYESFFPGDEDSFLSYMTDEEGVVYEVGDAKKSEIDGTPDGWALIRATEDRIEKEEVDVKEKEGDGL